MGSPEVSQRDPQMETQFNSTVELYTVVTVFWFILLILDSVETKRNCEERNDTEEHGGRRFWEVDVAMTFCEVCWI